MSEITLERIVEKFVHEGLEKKAENVVSYDLSGSGWITDQVVILGAGNTIHCKALLDALEKAYKQLSDDEVDELYDNFRTSGSSESGWVVVDLNSILIHCVTEDIRAFYDLDTLFSKQGVTYHH